LKEPFWRRDGGGLNRRESGFDEQFDFSLVTEAGDDTAIAGGIKPGEQHSSGFHKGILESHWCFMRLPHLACAHQPRLVPKQ
jgi:hypothetical protein